MAHDRRAHLARGPTPQHRVTRIATGVAAGSERERSRVGKIHSVDVDQELRGMRELDAAVLAGLNLAPENPRQPARKLRHAVTLRLAGVRGSLRRLERRGYIEPGWSVDSMGAHCQVTDLGKHVAGAAAAVLLAGSYGDPGATATAWLRMRLGRRLRS